MNLCSNGHDEVCYEGRNCPACALCDQIKTLEDEIEDLENTIDKLNEESQ